MRGAPAEIIPLLGQWWTEGNPLVLSFRGGRLQAELVGGSVGRNVSWFAQEAPNRYRVTLSSSDYERLVPWENQLTNSLAELVQEYLDENRWETIGDVEVYLARDDQLHTGVFGVASRMESNAPPRRDVWLLVHRDLRQTPLVRAVMTFLAECIRSKRQS